MRTTNQIVKGLVLLLLLVSGSWSSMAQTKTDATQSVCAGIEPYLVNPGNVANTFLWTITPGVSGTEWTISSATTAATDIIWANPATPQTYTVSFKEIDPVTLCYDEVSVSVTVNPLPVLLVTNPTPVCSPGTVDLSLAAVTAGSTLPLGTILTYWTDALATTALADPAAVAVTGIYYIKAATAEGCSDIKPVTVTINPLPLLVIVNPAPVCSPGTIDLTIPEVAEGSLFPAGTILTYWTDALATTPLADPAAVAASGTYYIKAATAEGCSVIEPVTVKVNPLPVLVIVFPAPVCSPGTVDLTLAAVTTGSTLPAGTILTYWTDATAATALATSTAVAASGTYYIKATTLEGCSVIEAVVVKVNPIPVLLVTNPTPVCSPGTIDLTLAAVTAGSTLPAGTVLTYWTDALATTSLATSSAVTASGTYYIKATTLEGCSVTEAVTVTVNPLPVLVVVNPTPACSPGTVDLTLAAVTAGSTLPAGTILTYWSDALATASLATSTAVAASGTYYIKATTLEGCSVIEAVTVTINPLPVLVVINPAPVCSPLTVDLTLPAVTAGSTLPVGTILTYWTDALATASLATSTAVAASGTYYIKAETAGGCSVVEAVTVTVNPLPVLVVVNPTPVCFPGTVDLTLAAVTAGSTLPAGTILTYWTDAPGTVSLATSSAVAASGTYYVMATTLEGCSVIEAVTVTVNPLPVLVVVNPAPVCSPGAVDLTLAAVTAGSTLPAGTILTYWTDALATTSLATSSAVAASGTYYIKAATVEGCSVIEPVTVTVNPLPVLVVVNPAPVCAPVTIDLTLPAVLAGSSLPAGTLLSYWTDALATATLATSTAVTASGTYYIKATTAEGCSVIEAVTVTVNPLPVLVVVNPAPACSPGTVDLTLAAVTAGSTLPAGTILTYWTDALATTSLANSSAVAASGTYYIKAATAEGCSVIEAVIVTVNPLPVLLVVNPAPVCAPGTIDLTLAAVTSGSTLPAGTILTYWTDATATTALATSSAVVVSGTYYIKATTAEGCSVTEAVTVTVNPLPVLVVTNPLPICTPNTVDLTLAAVTLGSTLPAGTILTYWTDATATTALATPAAVAASGTYYIKAATVEGCSVIEAVTVVINPIPTTSLIFHN